LWARARPTVAGRRRTGAGGACGATSAALRRPGAGTPCRCAAVAQARTA
jgi:hypothetical protein